jgi:hypothetical protein
MLLLLVLATISLSLPLDAPHVSKRADETLSWHVSESCAAEGTELGRNRTDADFVVPSLAIGETANVTLSILESAKLVDDLTPTVLVRLPGATGADHPVAWYDIDMRSAKEHKARLAVQIGTAPFLYADATYCSDNCYAAERRNTPVRVMAHCGHDLDLLVSASTFLTDEEHFNFSFTRLDPASTIVVANDGETLVVDPDIAVGYVVDLPVGECIDVSVTVDTKESVAGEWTFMPASEGCVVDDLVEQGPTSSSRRPDVLVDEADLFAAAQLMNCESATTKLEAARATLRKGRTFYQPNHGFLPVAQFDISCVDTRDGNNWISFRMPTLNQYDREFSISATTGVLAADACPSGCPGGYCDVNAGRCECHSSILGDDCTSRTFGEPVPLVLDGPFVVATREEGGNESGVSYSLDVPVNTTMVTLSISLEHSVAAYLRLPDGTRLHLAPLRDSDFAVQPAVGRLLTTWRVTDGKDHFFVNAHGRSGVWTVEVEAPLGGRYEFSSYLKAESAVTTATAGATTTLDHASDHRTVDVVRIPVPQDATALQVVVRFPYPQPPYVTDIPNSMLLFNDTLWQLQRSLVRTGTNLAALLRYSGMSVAPAVYEPDMHVYNIECDVHPGVDRFLVLQWPYQWGDVELNVTVQSTVGDSDACGTNNDGQSCHGMGVCFDDGTCECSRHYFGADQEHCSPQPNGGTPATFAAPLHLEDDCPDGIAIVQVDVTLGTPIPMSPDHQCTSYLGNVSLLANQELVFESLPAHPAGCIDVVPIEEHTVVRDLFDWWAVRYGDCFRPTDNSTYHAGQGYGQVLFFFRPSWFSTELNVSVRTIPQLTDTPMSAVGEHLRDTDPVLFVMDIPEGSKGARLTMNVSQTATGYLKRMNAEGFTVFPHLPGFSEESDAARTTRESVARALKKPTTVSCPASREDYVTLTFDIPGCSIAGGTSFVVQLHMRDRAASQHFTEISFEPDVETFTCPSSGGLCCAGNGVCTRGGVDGEGVCECDSSDLIGDACDAVDVSGRVDCEATSTSPWASTLTQTCGGFDDADSLAFLGLPLLPDPVYAEGWNELTKCAARQRAEALPVLASMTTASTAECSAALLNVHCTDALGSCAADGKSVDVDCDMCEAAVTACKGATVCFRGVPQRVEPVCNALREIVSTGLFGNVTASAALRDAATCNVQPDVAVEEDDDTAFGEGEGEDNGEGEGEDEEGGFDDDDDQGEGGVARVEDSGVAHASLNLVLVCLPAMVFA